jgi:hypothetical protein
VEHLCIQRSREFRDDLLIKKLVSEFLVLDDYLASQRVIFVADGQAVVP